MASNAAGLVGVVRAGRQAIAGFLSRPAVQFSMVGATGVVVNTAALAAAHGGIGLNYAVGLVVATQCSTLWNFAGIEWIIFSKRTSDDRSTRLGRLTKFATMNNVLTLLVRGPVVVLLTEWMHVHYLVSNVLSFGLLFVVRFAVAERLIWSPPGPALTSTG